MPWPLEGPWPKEGWSTNGPVCPFCDNEITPDEAHYYDESGYDLECDCGGHFRVRPHCSWSWSTRAKTFEDG